MSSVLHVIMPQRHHAPADTPLWQMHPFRLQHHGWATVCVRCLPVVQQQTGPDAVSFVLPQVNVLLPAGVKKQRKDDSPQMVPCHLLTF